MATPLRPITFDCPTCGDAVELPARLCLLEGDPPSGCDILIDLDAARLHARTHVGDQPKVGDLGPVMSAALNRFGVPY